MKQYGDEDFIFLIKEDEFSMTLPEMFAPMSKELAELKYPSVNRPDFISAAVDSDIYNLLFFSLKETMLMGSFNCLEPDMHDWKEIFLQMLQSIKFL